MYSVVLVLCTHSVFPFVRMISYLFFLPSILYTPILYYT